MTALFSTAILFLVSTLTNPCIAGYVLEDDYTPSQFFNMFTFFTGHDPTNGFVDYVDQVTAKSSGLISVGSNIYIGVDTTDVTPNGRPSVRLTSNKAYNHGLVILDLDHMPTGCGTWPAFWMVGPDWPNYGEIDIIEGVNLGTTNSMTLHTGPNCSITNNGQFTGTINTHQCYAYAPGQNENAGCGIGATSSLTYGAGFNNNNGGVYATEWTSEAISVWFFPRGSIPHDISRGHPKPSKWGQPVAMFQGACDIDSMIKDQQLVFDMTFCGDWAGNVWPSSSCASQASTCNAFVQNNPSAFKNTYWSINSLRVYQNSAGTPQSSSVMPTTHASSIAPTVAIAAESSTATSSLYGSSTSIASGNDKSHTSSHNAVATALTSTNSKAPSTTSAAHVGLLKGAAEESTTGSSSSTATSTSVTLTHMPGPTYAMYTSPFPMQGPIISTCNAFYFTAAGDTCTSIVDTFGNFTYAEYLLWNPSINAGCTNMWALSYFCIGVEDHTTTSIDDGLSDAAAYHAKRDAEDGDPAAPEMVRVRRRRYATEVEQSSVEHARVRRGMELLVGPTGAGHKHMHRHAQVHGFSGDLHAHALVHGLVYGQAVE